LIIPLFRKKKYSKIKGFFTVSAPKSPKGDYQHGFAAEATAGEEARLCKKPKIFNPNNALYGLTQNKSGI